MNNILKNYPECIFCKNTNLKLLPQVSKRNFYINAITKDLDLKNKFLNKIKIRKCGRCGIIQNSPWFKKEIAQKIYTNIYGQHNKNWSNAISYFKSGKIETHGRLFEFICEKFKIKKYAEYKSPFMGIMLNYFDKEFKCNKSILKKYFNLNIEYLNSRQVAGKNKKIMENSIMIGNRILQKKNNIKKKFLKKFEVKKYLLNDFSNFSWGINDNYKSVNSIALASEIFNNFKIIGLYDNDIPRFDLFGIFLTLDHSDKPRKILNFALNNSKHVLVHCHIDEEINKQHLFSFTKKFINYLNKSGIFTKDITNHIVENKYSEMYFLCSRKISYKF